VLGVRKDDKEIELAGILKEYTNEFIELLDIDQKEQEVVKVMTDKELFAEEPGVVIKREAGKFIIENNCSKTLYVCKVVAGDFLKKLRVICNPNSVADFFVEELPTDEVEIHYEIMRKMDAIIPRKHCLIRHSGEKPNSRLGF